ncbi:MAG: ORF6N domain-containing protein [Chitinispirillales bacterium]|jgi:hypothetical protein|nr:ORF6N domain-containing protein [Chitinispirillales bacterium]
MNNELIISQTPIENRIFTIRGVQVMLDRDLAEMYGVLIKQLNQQVKRNLDRFPDDFMFQLTESEWEILRSQNVTLRLEDAYLESENEITIPLRSQNVTLKSTHGKHRKYLPFVFTEQGVAGLSGVLKSEAAAKAHVAIMRAFAAMRKIIASHSGLIQRMDGLEQKQLETDQKFERVFKALEGDTIPAQCVFFNGQVFNAYELTSKIIRSAKQSIVLIDNYIDDTTLIHLSKKKKGVTVLLLTKKITEQLKLDIKKANEQYGGFEAKVFTQSHDRFLIIDGGKEVYHFGASLKDLGKSWFAFNKIDKGSVESIINAISTQFQN